MTPPDSSSEGTTDLSATHIAAAKLKEKITEDENISPAMKEALEADMLRLQNPGAVVTTPLPTAGQWKLKDIEIRGCRGIVDGPGLRFSARGVLMFGENGTGKSSYVDALEYAITTECKSLSKVQGISWKRHGTHIKSSSAPHIAVTFTKGTSEAVISLDAEGEPSPHDDLSDFVKEAKVRPFILRRSQMLKFIFAQPNERYDAIAGFLSLNDFNQLEEKLKGDHRKAQEHVQTDESTVKGTEQGLRKILNIPFEQNVDDASCLTGINAIVATTDIPQLTQLSDLPGTLTKLEEKIRGAGGDEALLAMQKLQNAATALVALTDRAIPDTANDYLSTRKQVLAEEAKLKGHYYGETLQQASRWIAEDRLEQCPVCEQDITPDAVVASIGLKLQARKELNTLQQDQRTKKQEFVERVTAWRNALQQCLDLGIESVSQATVDALTTIITTNAAFADEAGLQADIATINSLSLDTIHTEAARTVQQRQQAMFDPQAMSALAEAWRVLNVAKENLGKLETAQKQLEKSRKKRDEIGNVIQHAEDARKEAIDTILADIAELANGYFEKIHPGESLGGLTISSSKNKPNSLEISSKFHEKEGEHPRGYYSDAHLDTLGLCIFLALRRRHHQQAPGLSILVLDDVVHSVDAPHRERIAKLLLEDFSDHQLFITTHERLWFEYLKRLSNGQLEPLRITDWSLDSGPRLGDHRSDIEWLGSTESHTASAVDKASKAGRALEEILMHLCDHLHIPVPLKLDGRYFINDLWGSAYSRMKKNAGFFAAAQSHLEEIESLRSTRNWSSHWSQDYASLSDAEAKRFAEAVIGLCNVSYCAQCHDFIWKHDRLEGVWSCKQECLRYNATQTPAQSPASRTTAPTPALAV